MVECSISTESSLVSLNMTCSPSLVSLNMTCSCLAENAHMSN